MSWEWFTDALMGILRKHAISVEVPISKTGWTNPTMRNLPQIMAACYDGINNPDWRPQFNPDGSVKTTFCNLFVDYVAKEMGCSDLGSKMANDMIDYMSASPDWSEVPIADSQSKANIGSLLVAGEKATGHGHVNIIVPGIMLRSIHWAIQVPRCCNVGKDVFMGKGLSFAFREPPKIYVWRPSL